MAVARLKTTRRHPERHVHHVQQKRRARTAANARCARACLLLGAGLVERRRQRRPDDPMERGEVVDRLLAPGVSEELAEQRVR